MRLHEAFDATYEVLDKVEQGGMGAVYRVRHRTLGELRVLQILRSPLEPTPEMAERFLRQASAASALRHPNLAVLHDFDFTDGRALLVLEDVDGMTLREVLRRHGVPPLAVTLEIGRQVCAVLDFLHRERFILRDLSPAGIMLGREIDGWPRVKLLDLGLGRSLEAGSDGQTTGGVFLGRLRYAAPEQFGDGAVDERSDVYSLGIVLYELLTGRTPLTGRDPRSWMAAHLFGQPLDFAESDPQGMVPDDLRSVILHALARDPAERIGSAADLGDSLAAIQARFPLAGDELVPLFPTQDVETAKAPEISALHDERAATGDPENVLDVVLPAAAGGSLLDRSPADEVAWDVRLPGKEQSFRQFPARRWSSVVQAALAIAAVLAAVFVFVEGRRISRPLTARPEPVAQTPQTEPQETYETYAEETPPPVPEESPVSVPIQDEAPKPVIAKPSPSSEPKRLPVKEGESRTPRTSVRIAENRTQEPRPLIRPLPPPPVTPRSSGPMRRGDYIIAGPEVSVPVPLDLPRFSYPAAARGQGLEVDVRLDLLVDENGKVIDARVREGDTSGLGFNEIALAAARKVPFQPGTRGDVPGKMWTEMIFEFADPAAAPSRSSR